MTENKIQYIDAFICFCRYYLMSKHIPHQTKNIHEFLLYTKTSSLIKMGKDLKEGTLVYDIWQIFEPLNNEEIENIRLAAVNQIADKIEKKKIRENYYK